MKHFLVPFAIMIVAVLLAAPQAAAQDGVVSTTYELKPEKFAGKIPAGDSTTGFIHLDVCWQQGGFNPQGDKWTFTLEQPESVPEGISIGLPPDAAFEYTPPQDAQTEAKCARAVSWQLDASVEEGAEMGTVHTISFTMTPPTTPAGTYKAPTGTNTVDMTLETDVADEGPIPGVGGGGNETEDPGTAGGDTDTEEGPVPMPPLFAALTLLAFAFLRRRA